MKAIDLEAAIARCGSSPSAISLRGDRVIEPVTLVSVSCGRHPTLWILAGGEDLFIDVEEVELLTCLRSASLPDPVHRQLLSAP